VAKVSNYLSTLHGSISLQKLEYLLRCSRKNEELALNSTFFFELKVFSNAELEWSGKKQERISPKHPILRT